MQIFSNIAKTYLLGNGTYMINSFLSFEYVNTDLLNRLTLKFQWMKIEKRKHAQNKNKMRSWTFRKQSTIKERNLSFERIPKTSWPLIYEEIEMSKQTKSTVPPKSTYHRNAFQCLTIYRLDIPNYITQMVGRHQINQGK